MSNEQKAKIESCVGSAEPERSERGGASAGAARPLRASANSIRQRRWQTFKANRRGYISAIILLSLFTLSVFAELIANDTPLLVYYKGQLLTPITTIYTEKETFAGVLESEADYRYPFIIDEINAHGWMLNAPIPFDYHSINFATERAPAAPSFANYFGTDDQARDVLARIIYGFRLSMCFAMLLVFFSAIIGITVGALSGYFGGLLDLLLQRFIEIWEGIPLLFLLIILSSIVVPNFWWVLGLMLLFRWMSLVDVVRAEFLRTRNFDYVKAARALGLPELTILYRHVLPNALVSVFTFLPFLITGAITTLTSLDFLGFGLPLGSPSLGELLAQGKNNPQAPWLGLIGFFTLATMLSLWLFVGEAVRDAFNPRKIFVRGEK